MREITPLIIVGIPLLLALIDILLYWSGGNEATISKVMFDISSSRRMVALSTGYSAGLLLGHFFFPAYTIKYPPTYEIIARMVWALSPTFYAMIIIGAGNGVTQSHEVALEHGGQLLLAAYMLTSIIIGGLVGKYIICQHIMISVPI